MLKNILFFISTITMINTALGAEDPTNQPFYPYGAFVVEYKVPRSEKLDYQSAQGISYSKFDYLNKVNCHCTHFGDDFVQNAIKRVIFPIDFKSPKLTPFFLESAADYSGPIHKVIFDQEGLNTLVWFGQGHHHISRGSKYTLEAHTSNFPFMITQLKGNKKINSSTQPLVFLDKKPHSSRKVEPKKALITPPALAPKISYEGGFLALFHERISDKDNDASWEYTHEVKKIEPEGTIASFINLTCSLSKLEVVNENLALCKSSDWYPNHAFNIMNLETQELLIPSPNPCLSPKKKTSPDLSSMSEVGAMMFNPENVCMIYKSWEHIPFSRECLKTVTLGIHHPSSEEITLLTPLKDVWTIPLIGEQILGDYVFIYYGNKCGDEDGRLAYWKISPEGKEIASGVLNLPPAHPGRGSIQLRSDNCSFYALESDDKTQLGIMRYYDGGELSFDHRSFSFSYHQILIREDGHLDQESLQTQVLTESTLMPAIRSLPGYEWWNDRIYSYGFFLNPYAKVINF